VGEAPGSAGIAELLVEKSSETIQLLQSQLTANEQFVAERKRLVIA
jgi:hypothetical protein